MSQVIPQGDNSNKKSEIPSWVNVKSLKKIANSEVTSTQKLKNQLPNESKAKEITVSYSCTACKKIFATTKLNTQIRQATREAKSYITCPECGAVLKKYKTARVVENTKTNKATNQFIPRKPGRVPNSWVDKALYGRMVHQLGKFCEQLGLTGAQLRFQRGIRSSQLGISGPKQAEFSIDYIDSNGLRKRIYTTAQLAPSGDFHEPKTFKLASGQEYPFTKESLNQLEQGEKFEFQSPKVPLPRVVYRDQDMTRFPFAWSNKRTEKMEKTSSKSQENNLDLLGYKACKKANLIKEETTSLEDYSRIAKLANYPTSKSELFGNDEVRNAFLQLSKQHRDAVEKTALNAYNYAIATQSDKKKAVTSALNVISEYLDQEQDYVQSVVTDAVNEGLTYEEVANQLREEYGTDLTPEMWEQAASKVLIETTASTKVAVTQGEVVNYRGSDYDVQTVRPDGVAILKSRTTGDTAYVPSEKHHEMMGVDNPMDAQSNIKSLAIEVLNEEYQEETKKVAAREEKTYIPIVDEDPDYSLAEQTQQSEAPFNVPYSEMDQGILPEKDRNYHTMFRANRLNLKKEAVKLSTIKHEDGKWKVYDSSGKDVLGTHDTKEEAQDQLAAIEVNKKEGAKNPHDHQHPYNPKTEKFPEPNKKEVEEFDKRHPKKSSHIHEQKYGETTNYKNEDDGWPFEYDRCRKLLESKLRQDRNPIEGVDLQALKDGKYSRDEIVEFLDKLKGSDTFMPPTTSKVDPKTLKTISYNDLMSELDKAIQDEMEGQQHYQDMMELTSDQEVDNMFAELSGDEAEHQALLKDVQREQESPEKNLNPTNSNDLYGGGVENDQDHPPRI